jgi:hypothetical protein
MSSDELTFNVFDVAVIVGGTVDTSFLLLLSICESKYCTEKFFI